MEEQSNSRNGEKIERRIVITMKRVIRLRKLILATKERKGETRP